MQLCKIPSIGDQREGEWVKIRKPYNYGWDDGDTRRTRDLFYLLRRCRPDVWKTIVADVCCDEKHKLEESSFPQWDQ